MGEGAGGRPVGAGPDAGNYAFNTMKYAAAIGEKIYDIEIGANNTISIDGEAHSIDFRGIHGTSLFSVLIDNKSWEVLVERTGDDYRISIADELLLVTVYDERTRKIEKGLGKTSTQAGEITLKAPMPGLVRQVTVESGQEVKAGQGLVILEAMKMENELRAPRAGTIREIRVKPGDKVEHGQSLLVIK
jgi:biotin carboxyl carrier protein